MQWKVKGHKFKHECGDCNSRFDVPTFKDGWIHCPQCGKAKPKSWIEEGQTYSRWWRAFASFSSDMSKHPETAGHSALPLGAMLLIGGHLGTATKMERWILGFN